ncbi:hypothetical protein [Asaia astilbis]
MFEVEKAVKRYVHDSRFSGRYFRGRGYETNPARVSLKDFQDTFPLMQIAPEAEFGEEKERQAEFIFACHSLEKMPNPFEGLKGYIDRLAPGGHFVGILWDEDMYEQGQFPSSYSPDHKWSFTIAKTKSWSSRSVGILKMLLLLDWQVEVIKIEKIDHTYQPPRERGDQSLSAHSECSVEIVLRKRS